MLVGRTLTAILVGGGSPVVHAVVKRARDPLAGVFRAQARQEPRNTSGGGCGGRPCCISVNAGIVTGLLAPILVNLVTSIMANLGELGVQLMKAYRV